MARYYDFVHKEHVGAGGHPDDHIKYIEESFPFLKGLCFFENGRLNTKDPYKASFYYDPYHSVLEVKYKLPKME